MHNPRLSKGYNIPLKKIKTKSIQEFHLLIESSLIIDVKKQWNDADKDNEYRVSYANW